MRLPDGEVAPADGMVPPGAAAGAAARSFHVYVHVPFCRVRCGYCDFNTYTPRELAGEGGTADGAASALVGPSPRASLPLGPAPTAPLGADPATYAGAVERELALATRALRASGVPDRPAATVFLGGGTPTMLPVRDLARVLRAVESSFGIVPGAEVTTEANPDSVDAAALRELAAAGFTRVSFGVQSFVPGVLATLDRTHDAARVPQVVAWAREAGLAVSLDLIYGTPGETLADWERSLREAVALAPDHISAYALTVEEGTALHRRVRRGELPAPTDDDEAAKYELADAMLAAAGYGWYEISNWARTSADRCRHNVAYWENQDWWGVGPGAHSHVGGVRWWNVKHPRAWGGRLAAGESPAAAREILDDDARHLEDLLLRTRLSAGYPLADLRPHAREEAHGLVADGLATLVEGRDGAGDRLVLTRRGRLLADTVVHRLT